MTVYDVIAAPPFEAGGLQVTADEEFTLLVPDTPVGAPGTVAGIATAEGAEAAPVPTELVASTSNSYEIPLVSPVAV
jgi:hypothetical protein